MNFNVESKNYFPTIKEKWKALQNTPEIFAYNLNVTQKKYLPGNYKFYTELNLERTALRRAPQQITSLTPFFDANKFNFQKVHPKERLLGIHFENNLISLIINRSPLTDYHTLICPNLEKGLPQIITQDALHFCVAFLLQLDEPYARIGYNSPGALASVNHLHLHLMYIDLDLYIDNAKLVLLASKYIFRLSSEMPTEAICFVINIRDNDAQKTCKLLEIYNFMQWLCAENLPHNMFMTPTRDLVLRNSGIKVFVFARAKHCIIKDVTSFNIGFCELSGYIPVGSIDLYENLSEDKVVSKINAETSEAYTKLYSYFLNKQNFTTG